MSNTNNITIEQIKQNTAFKNIKAFLECNISGITEQLLNDYFNDIAKMTKTYYIKYGVDLDDIIAEALFAFAVRVGDYPDTSRFESYSKENICKYVRRHIIKYCKQELKTESLEKQKQERYIRYIK